jgi:hypothetical protein
LDVDSLKGILSKVDVTKINAVFEAKKLEINTNIAANTLRAVQ